MTSIFNQNVITPQLIMYLNHKKKKLNKNINLQQQQSHNTIIESKVEEKISEQSIIDIQKKFLDSIQNKKNLERLQIVQSLPVKKKFNSEHNYSENVYLLDNFIVKKSISNSKLGYHLFHNELKSLLKLIGVPHMPQLVAANNRTLQIYMTYCGNPINHKNLPDDWQNQVKEIHNIFQTVNFHSNDMILRNTTVLNNKIYIIDFGLNNQFSIDLDNEIKKFYNQLYSLSIKKRNLRLS